MSDFASAPVQVIAEALLVIDAGGNPQVLGRGFSTVARGITSPVGDFVLTFDAGVVPEDVGSGSLVGRPGFGYTDGRVGPNGVDPNMARVSLTVRSGTTAPGTTTICDPTTVLATGAQGTQLNITLTDTAGAFVDPMGAGAANAVGGGLEIMVFYGNATPDSFSQQLVGPAFQPAMTFP